ncbi:MAG: flagellin [Alphaproteobacteria bacterium]
MALNLISNFAANVAHRNLVKTDMATTSSLAKLSSGTRVVSAKDDAASLAIGKRLESEVASLRQAQVNAGQASSMLQIADGALATISDIVTRMKTLAVQSSSGQLSDTERVLLDAEFTSLRSELDRIAQDTEFNGTALLNGSNTFSASSVGTDIEAADGFELFSFGSNPGSTFLSAGDTLALVFVTATNILTVTNQTTLQSDTVTVNAPPAAGSFSDILLGDFNLTIRLNSLFATDVAVSANNTLIIAGGTSNTFSLTFKVGTGTASFDSISFSVKQATAAELASGLDTQTIAAQGDANTAIGLLSTAIDKVNEIRADIGAAQNRVEFASQNLGSSIENSEAARSNLLDLDIAAEMTVFASKQVLMQAGISMLAQAQQIPQNLLKLLG